MSFASKPRVPVGLRDLMKDFTRDILKEKPIDISDFAEHYFCSRLSEKENYAVNNYEETAVKYDFSYTQDLQHYQVPVSLVYSIISEGLTNLIKDLIKAVLREQPQNLCDFALEYFRHKKAASKEPEAESMKNNYTAYENYLINKEPFIFTPYVKCACGRTLDETYTTHRLLNRHINQIRKIEGSETIAQSNLADNEKNFSEYNTSYSKKYMNSIYIIQKNFRRYLVQKNSATKPTVLPTNNNGINTQQFSPKNLAMPVVPQLQINQNVMENISENGSYTSAPTAQMSATECGRETKESIIISSIIGDEEIENNENNNLIYLYQAGSEAEQNSEEIIRFTDKKNGNSSENRIFDGKPYGENKIFAKEAAAEETKILAFANEITESTAGNENVDESNINVSDDLYKPDISVNIQKTAPENLKQGICPSEEKLLSDIEVNVFKLCVTQKENHVDHDVDKTEQHIHKAHDSLHKENKEEVRHKNPITVYTESASLEEISQGKKNVNQFNFEKLSIEKYLKPKANTEDHIYNKITDVDRTTELLYTTSKIAKQIDNNLETVSNITEVSDKEKNEPERDLQVDICSSDKLINADYSPVFDNSLTISKLKVCGKKPNFEKRKSPDSIKMASNTIAKSNEVNVEIMDDSTDECEAKNYIEKHLSEVAYEGKLHIYKQTAPQNQPVPEMNISPNLIEKFIDSELKNDPEKINNESKNDAVDNELDKNIKSIDNLKNINVEHDGLNLNIQSLLLGKNNSHIDTASQDNKLSDKSQLEYTEQFSTASFDTTSKFKNKSEYVIKETIKKAIDERLYVTSSGEENKYEKFQTESNNVNNTKLNEVDTDNARNNEHNNENCEFQFDSNTINKTFNEKMQMVPEKTIQSTENNNKIFESEKCNEIIEEITDTVDHIKKGTEEKLLILKHFDENTVKTAICKILPNKTNKEEEKPDKKLQQILQVELDKKNKRSDSIEFILTKKSELKNVKIATDSHTESELNDISGTLVETASNSDETAKKQEFQKVSNSKCENITDEMKFTKTGEGNSNETTQFDTNLKLQMESDKTYNTAIEKNKPASNLTKSPHYELIEERANSDEENNVSNEKVDLDKSVAISKYETDSMEETSLIRLEDQSDNRQIVKDKILQIGNQEVNRDEQDMQKIINSVEAFNDVSKIKLGECSISDKPDKNITKHFNSVIGTSDTMDIQYDSSIEAVDRIYNNFVDNSSILKSHEQGNNLIPPYSNNINTDNSIKDTSICKAVNKTENVIESYTDQIVDEKIDTKLRLLSEIPQLEIESEEYKEILKNSVDFNANNETLNTDSGTGNLDEKNYQDNCFLKLMDIKLDTLSNNSISSVEYMDDITNQNSIKADNFISKDSTNRTFILKTTKPTHILTKKNTGYFNGSQYEIEYITNEMAESGSANCAILQLEGKTNTDKEIYTNSRAQVTQLRKHNQVSEEILDGHGSHNETDETNNFIDSSHEKIYTDSNKEVMKKPINLIETSLLLLNEMDDKSKQPQLSGSRKEIQNEKRNQSCELDTKTKNIQILDKIRTAEEEHNRQFEFSINTKQIQTLEKQLKEPNVNVSNKSEIESFTKENPTISYEENIDTDSNQSTNQTVVTKYDIESKQSSHDSLELKEKEVVDKDLGEFVASTFKDLKGSLPKKLVIGKQLTKQDSENKKYENEKILSINNTLIEKDNIERGQVTNMDDISYVSKYLASKETTENCQKQERLLSLKIPSKSQTDQDVSNENKKINGTEIPLEVFNNLGQVVQSSFELHHSSKFNEKTENDGVASSTHLYKTSNLLKSNTHCKDVSFNNGDQLHDTILEKSSYSGIVSSQNQNQEDKTTRLYVNTECNNIKDEESKKDLRRSNSNVIECENAENKEIQINISNKDDDSKEPKNDSVLQNANDLQNDLKPILGNCYQKDDFENICNNNTIEAIKDEKGEVWQGVMRSEDRHKDKPDFKDINQKLLNEDENTMSSSNKLDDRKNDSDEVHYNSDQGGQTHSKQNNKNSENMLTNKDLVEINKYSEQNLQNLDVDIKILNLNDQKLNNKKPSSEANITSTSKQIKDILNNIDTAITSDSDDIIASASSDIKKEPTQNVVDNESFPSFITNATESNNSKKKLLTASYDSSELKIVHATKSKENILKESKTELKNNEDFDEIIEASIESGASADTRCLNEQDAFIKEDKTEAKNKNESSKLMTSKDIVGFEENFKYGETTDNSRARKIKENKIKWVAMRQNSMPVQIDSEVLRVMPKFMRKKTRSAEGAKKNKRHKVLKE